MNNLDRRGAPLELLWIGSSRKDLSEFPEAVRRQFGYLIAALERGAVPAANVKRWHGDHGKTFELTVHGENDTYRAVYTTRRPGRLIVLHAFQKKSPHGRATPRQHIALIERRQRIVSDLI